MDLLNRTSTRPPSAAYVLDETRLSAQAASADGRAPNADDQAAGTPASTADSPATTARVSRGGFLLRFFQHVEEQHPEQVKESLSGIADKLRADAERAGPWGERLNAWADKFDKAAESGDLSSLVPSRPHAHFGMRAYQQAQSPETAASADISEVAQAVKLSEPATAPGVEAAPQAPAAAADQPGKSSARDLAEPQGPPIIVPTYA